MTVRDTGNGRLVLGTAQIGLNYGVANQGGQISVDNAKRILDTAQKCGIQMLDTAKLYGESESRLGNIGVSEWQIVTKLPEVPDGIKDINAWCDLQITSSLGRLKVARLYGILLHRPSQLLGPIGPSLYCALTRMQDDGLVQKTGISVYDTTELEKIWKRFRFEIVQAPLSIMDRRFEHSGWLARLALEGCEIHARSILLQGLLMMRQLPTGFGKWQHLWNEWYGFLEKERLQSLNACLSYALSHREVARVVVGVDKEAQLQEILTTVASRKNIWPADLWCSDCELLNPSLWPKKSK